MNDRLRDTAALAWPVDLVERYRPGMTLFASPRQTLLTEGVESRLPACDPSQLAQAAQAMLDDARNQGWPLPVLMGAVPFASEKPAELYMPALVTIGPGTNRPDAPVTRTPPPAERQPVSKVLMTPSPADYRRNVTLALEQIEARQLEKVVLSRSLSVEARVDLPGLMQRLAARNPLGYTFAIDLGTNRHLVGASPELLLSRKDRLVRSHPLAGSVPRSADPVEDRQRAAALLESGKDLHEHKLVVDAVAAGLRPFCRELEVPARPSLVCTQTMWHLGTEIRGELHALRTSSLELALALHPTPAVCGHPTAEARDFIESVEGFDRGFFTGLTGWCDADGDGEWAVTIRCAEVSENQLTLYAGAGVVAGSVPASELAETSAKLRTMLGAMALESVLEDQS
ncbi:isochorismate synthase [Parachitinimonas caeni]|uniref:isochorismate synthase n=1 Tax=Parachitinimonas caeni TaxID=3031301 RepID=A0ABT7DYK9_9NEIS|nr:isochorismate synthase [Parachitinimonas caeni]MDK2125149.1 isochorismate synthase [Parachitinimonas caeni]